MDAGIIDLLKVAFAAAPGVIPWVIMIVMIVVLIKAIQPFTAMRDGKETSEVNNLRERVVKLEGQIEKLMNEREKERKEHSEERERQQADHDAKMQVLRHSLNNESAVLDSLLLLLKAGKVDADLIEEIERRRSDRAQTIAAEKGALAGARISRRAPPVQDEPLKIAKPGK